jgi:hypothetical protein
MKSESVTHGIYVILASASFIGNTRILTNVQIRDEFRHSLPCKIHGTKALSQKREPRPRRIFDETTRLQKYKLEFFSI